MICGKSDQTSLFDYWIFKLCFISVVLSAHRKPLTSKTTFKQGKASDFQTTANIIYHKLIRLTHTLGSLVGDQPPLPIIYNQINK
jgi:hypothetical protein